jgi:hypothetical protein
VHTHEHTYEHTHEHGHEGGLGPSLTRRQLLRGSGAAGAMLLAPPLRSFRGGLEPLGAATVDRGSRLSPGQRVVHADLHNHTLLSDGAGDPAEAFASMRAAGLDVAALTDHATISEYLPESPCVVDPSGGGCQSLAGIHEGSWQRTAALADDADEPGAFTAIRGFEWSSPTLGHMNVWFSEDWADPLHTGGLGSPEDIAAFAASNGGPAVLAQLADLVRTTPAAGAGMRAWYEWLRRDPSTPVLGGGADGLAGFNHPGREELRFSEFTHDPALVDRVVSLELFNRREDYLFERVDDGRTSPLVACLDAGWRTGLIGVTDEHGTDWGFPEGKGRAGLWVDELSRDGVRAALLDRRVYATNRRGLRLDATANGVRMGRTLGHRSGPVEFAIDLAGGPAEPGTVVGLQVLRTGSLLPGVVDAVEVVVPDDDVLRLTVPVDVADGDWLVLRVSLPGEQADGRADATYRGFGSGIAY